MFGHCTTSTHPLKEEGDAVSSLACHYRSSITVLLSSLCPFPSPFPSPCLALAPFPALARFQQQAACPVLPFVSHHSPHPPLSACISQQLEQIQPTTTSSQVIMLLEAIGLPNYFVYLNQLSFSGIRRTRPQTELEVGQPSDLEIIGGWRRLKWLDRLC